MREVLASDEVPNSVADDDTALGQLVREPADGQVGLLCKARQDPAALGLPCEWRQPGEGWATRAPASSPRAE